MAGGMPRPSANRSKTSSDVTRRFPCSRALMCGCGMPSSTLMSVWLAPVHFRNTRMTAPRSRAASACPHFGALPQAGRRRREFARSLGHARLRSASSYQRGIPLLASGDAGQRASVAAMSIRSTSRSPAGRGSGPAQGALAAPLTRGELAAVAAGIGDLRRRLGGFRARVDALEAAVQLPPGRTSRSTRASRSAKRSRSS